MMVNSTSNDCNALKCFAVTENDVVAALSRFISKRHLGDLVDWRNRGRTTALALARFRKYILLNQKK